MRIIHDRSRSVDLDEFLTRPVFAHLATLSEDGPRDSPVWFLREDEAIWIIGSRMTDSFPARIESDPRCAVGIVDFDVATGHVQHIGFRGKATIEPFDPERAKRLLSRYLGDELATWDRSLPGDARGPRLGYVETGGWGGGGKAMRHGPVEGHWCRRMEA